MAVSLLVFFCWLKKGHFCDDCYTLAGVTFLLMLVVFHGANLYRPWRGQNLGRLAGQVLLAWAIVVAILIAIGFVSHYAANYSRRVVISWAVITPLALLGLRFLVYSGLHWLRARGLNTRSVVIAGAGNLGQRLAENMIDTPWLGIRLLGFFDDQRAGEKIPIGPDSIEVPVLANLDKMVEFVKQNSIDMVYLALPLRAEDRLREVVNALQDTTSSVYFVPDVFAFSLLRASLSELRGIPMISLWETPFYGVNRLLKRTLDIALATLIILCFAPLMAIIALGLKLSSPGPIVFKQRRYGLDGREILINKFRTMTVCQDGPEIPQARSIDPRITGFGNFLRKTSLDELPQFFNVLQGTMSIVGPRPHAIAHNEFYRRCIPGYMLRHKILPGLTGWAQVNGWRGETEILEKMEKRIEYDLYYLCNWSLWLDLKIIFRTAFLVVRDPHAY